MIDSREQDNIYLNLGKIQRRKYQLSIAKKCVSGNHLVVIPTGLGKTIIGIITTGLLLKKVPKGSKVVILAPTRPLLDQHFKEFKKFLRISEEKFIMLTGANDPEERGKLFDNYEIFFLTPQTLRNDLVNKRYNLKEVCFILFDEAHHASGDYPYSTIAQIFTDENPDGIILGMTASPGYSQEKIQQLCKNLKIPLKNILSRTRKDHDVEEYVAPVIIKKISVEMSKLMEGAYETLIEYLEELLTYLVEKEPSKNILRVGKVDKLTEKITRKDLLKLRTKLTGLINNPSVKSLAYEAISINASALILYHMVELAEQQGLNILLNYYEKLKKETRSQSCSKAKRRIVSDYRISSLFTELEDIKRSNEPLLYHPKLSVLARILKKQFKKNKDSKILIFNKLRDSVKFLTKELNKLSEVKAKRFVGQTSKRGDKGLSQKEQIQILEMFKDGDHNTLISTNVGEEGLDVAECDLVIFYDVVVSAIRLIQRKGRTGRNREGEVVILYTKGKREEIYLNIALMRAKKMRSNIQISKEPNKSRSITNFLADDKVKDTKQISLDDMTDSIKREKSLKKLNSPLPKVVISNDLPMKYGLRKELKKYDCDLHISDSPGKIVKVDKKILLKFYNIESLYMDDIYQVYMSNVNLYDLVLIIVDFIGLKEQIKGEKRVLKNKIKKYMQEHSILKDKIILIDYQSEINIVINGIMG